MENSVTNFALPPICAKEPWGYSQWVVLSISVSDDRPYPNSNQAGAFILRHKEQRLTPFCRLPYAFFQKIEYHQKL